MKILLTGANGYIGRRLLPVLVNLGHEVYACVRDKNTLHLSRDNHKSVTVLEVDFLDQESISQLPQNIDIAYYLIHSLNDKSESLHSKESRMAQNFTSYINKTKAKQIIYLGGISNDENLSKHLQSRKVTETILKESNVPLTSLRAAIIIGSGGASFEIIRDLVEKLPIMIAPKWLNTKCQPISIRNVIEYLSKVIAEPKTYDKVFDIGGPEVLTYKQMLLSFAEVRKMKRRIYTIPVMTPRLSSYWLYFVTATSYRLAVNLVDSMKNEVVVKKGNIQGIIPINLLSYKESVSLSFKRIEQNMVVSSWTDTQLPNFKLKGFSQYIQVPQNGTFKDVQQVCFEEENIQTVMDNIWSIGGDRGWYYGNWLWKIRGYIDKLFGGVGLRRGRRSPNQIFSGDSLDFWRVLLADKSQRRLLLYAEMKLPGEAWLEFAIKKEKSKTLLLQTATFRPKGVWGRVYWFSVLPFHWFIFKNMAQNIVESKNS